MKRIDDDVIKDRLVFPDMDGSYPLKLAVVKNHFNGVLKSIVKGDRLGLADYETPGKVHITADCWWNKGAKSALLILKNIKSRERRNKLIEKQYTFRISLSVDNALVNSSILTV